MDRSLSCCSRLFQASRARFAARKLTDSWPYPHLFLARARAWQELGRRPVCSSPGCDAGATKCAQDLGDGVKVATFLRRVCVFFCVIFILFFSQTCSKLSIGPAADLAFCVVSRLPGVSHGFPKGCFLREPCGRKPLPKQLDDSRFPLFYRVATNFTVHRKGGRCQR